MQADRLSVTSLCKTYTTPVLKNIDLKVAPGEIHAIVGENGAGKTTLVNILAGLVQRDSGVLMLDGIPFEPSDARGAIESGISCATQELSIIDTLDVAENILLKRLPIKYWRISQDELYSRARELLDQVGLTNLEVDKRTRDLSLSERQLVELAKTLESRSRLLVLDEPTSALNGSQAERLHNIIAERAACGTSVIYISHRLNDVLQIADSITILRDGQLVESGSASEFSVSGIIEKMGGQSRHQQRPDKSTVAHSTNTLSAHRITTRELPFPISLTCHPGEIIGLAGLAGSGRTELLNALFGLAPLTGGRVSRRRGDETVSIHNPRSAVKSGIGYVGEDRQTTGIFPGLGVSANMTLPGISGIATSMGVLRRAKETAQGCEYINSLSIKCAGPDQNITELSGGNQQKVLIARWLHCDTEVFLLDEPTRGVDITTKHAIYELLFDMQRNGKTIIVASSEIEELLAICSRIAVLSSRQLVREFGSGELSERDILAAAFQAHTLPQN